MTTNCLMSILERYVLLTVTVSTKETTWSYLFILASPKNLLLSVCSAKIIILYGYHYFIIWYDIDFIVF